MLVGVGRMSGGVMRRCKTNLLTYHSHSVYWGPGLVNFILCEDIYLKKLRPFDSMRQLIMMKTPLCKFVLIISR